MEGENGIKKDDGGISDVLSEAGKRDLLRTDNNQTSHSETEPDLNGTVGLTNSSTNDSLRNGKNEKDKHDHAKQKEVLSEEQLLSPGGTFTGELNLADPESVIHMLETIDLTEEDTEDLLQEAYKMNRKLKEMLRRKEDASKPKLKSKSKTTLELNSSLTSASSSNGNSRTGSSVGIRKVLPPISTGNREASVYAIKLQRSKTNVPDSKMTTSDTMVLRSKSTKESVRKDAQSPTRRRRASGPRPEWNDRFNFS